MRSFLLIWFVLDLLSSVSLAQEKVSAGTVNRLQDFHSEYVDPRNVDVWLPENYSSSKKYAVLYMHDGQMLFDSTATWNHQEWKVDETMSKLTRENKIMDCIVVGIWNNGKLRHSEYTPQKAVSGLPDAVLREILKDSPEGFKSDNYLKFLVSELKPFIDSAFSTKSDQQHTFIAGSSMGGLISLYAICEFPTIFGGAACMSTHWPGSFRTENNPIPAAFFQYMRQNLPSPQNHKIYFDHGTETLDAWYAAFQAQADEIMKAKGYSQGNWETRVFQGADHSERSWAEHLEFPITFLLHK